MSIEIMLTNTVMMIYVDECLENTTGCECVDDGSTNKKCLCEPGYQLDPRTFHCIS